MPLAAVAAAMLAAAAGGQTQSVVDTVHNLSASGPGQFRAATEQRVCIFCHTPHRAAPIQPLWNRMQPVSAYTVYDSSSLDANPGQPTGASKMCLSCHDGTIALGSVLSQDQVIQMAGGITTLPPGGANLGTDLSDDHPISFRFDSTLAARDRRLTDPLALPDSMRLDANQELQCTTCHDPHNNVFGDFLVMSNSNSALCRSCHSISRTTVRAHSDCQACHQSHAAPSGPYLMTEANVSETCLRCHDGSYPAAEDILSDLNGFSSHDTSGLVEASMIEMRHDTREFSHTDCADCHDAHTMTSGTALAPLVAPSMGEVAGVSASGGELMVAKFEYEVCYRCHADNNVFSASWVPRQITQVNTRLEFATSAVSYHPVQGPGRNTDVPSLKPGWTTASIVGCSDCHGSDLSRKAGGRGPNGIHGSSEPPLLLAPYETRDFTPESSTSYALCYRCHERDGPNGILGDRSFPHRVHVSESSTPCSACHDAHGISSAQGNPRNNTHLINFDTSIVFPDPVSGKMEFQDTGMFSGNCTVNCHGVVHNRTPYRGR
jgi:predicted CXXCH cytochrome family protein